MCLFPISIRTHPNNGISEVVTVPCGNCVECCIQHSVEWAYRIMHEAKQYSESCFVTLTYNEKHLPISSSGYPTLLKKDLQDFIKRFRKSVSKVRYFACGEYGSRGGRPHYHLILFGWSPSDGYFFQRDERGNELFRSPTLEKIWSSQVSVASTERDFFGFVSYGKLTFDSAKYCAKYMQKFNSALHSGVVSPFISMSTHPGIGYNFVYNCDLNSDRVYHNGRGIKIPRYYLKVMERDGICLDTLKLRRLKNAEIYSAYSDINERRKKYSFLFEKIIRRS